MNRQLVVEEVAEKLRLNPQHVRALIRRGELKASNVGSQLRPVYRIDESAVKEFLKDRAVTT